jgi:lipopolysaccharide exporter
LLKTYPPLKKNNLKENLLFDLNKSVKWLSALQASEMAVQSILKIAVAWILSPEAFGIIGSALLLTGFVQATSQTGVVAALIQKEKRTESFLNEGWTIEIIRGVLTYSVIFLSAPIYIYYMTGSINDDYVEIIRVIGLTSLLESSRNIGIIYFDKQLDFKKLFILQITGITARTISTLALCLYLGNHWGMAYGMIIGSFFLFVTSYLLSDYKMGFSFKFKNVKELLDFGIWVFLYTIVGYAILKIGDFVVFKNMGVKELGIFQMAFFIGMLFRNAISEIQNKIVFPLASKYQNDLGEIKALYANSVDIGLLIYVAAGIGLALISERLVITIFNESWIQISEILPVLSVAGIFGALTRTIEQIYKGVGAPKEIFVFCVITCFVLLFSVYFLFENTLLGVSYAVLVSSLTHFLVIIIHSLFKFNMSINLLFAKGSLILMASFFMAMWLTLFNFFIKQNSLTFLILEISTGLLAYIIFLYLLFKVFQKETLYSFLNTLKSFRSSI